MGRKIFTLLRSKFCLFKPVKFLLSFQKHAYPADELMPLTCRGRYRGSEPSRGDVDDSLGKYVYSSVVHYCPVLSYTVDVLVFIVASKIVVNWKRCHQYHTL